MSHDLVTVESETQRLIAEDPRAAGWHDLTVTVHPDQDLVKLFVELTPEEAPGAPVCVTTHYAGKHPGMLRNELLRAVQEAVGGG